jgi:hypothetical protein
MRISFSLMGASSLGFSTLWYRSILLPLPSSCTHKATQCHNQIRSGRESSSNCEHASAKRAIYNGAAAAAASARGCESWSGFGRFPAVYLRSGWGPGAGGCVPWLAGVDGGGEGNRREGWEEKAFIRPPPFGPGKGSDRVVPAARLGFWRLQLRRCPWTLRGSSGAGCRLDGRISGTVSGGTAGISPWQEVAGGCISVWAE